MLSFSIFLVHSFASRTFYWWLSTGIHLQSRQGLILILSTLMLLNWCAQKKYMVKNGIAAAVNAVSRVEKRKKYVFLTYSIAFVLGLDMRLIQTCIEYQYVFQLFPYLLSSSITANDESFIKPSKLRQDFDFVCIANCSESLLKNFSNLSNKPKASWGCTFSKRQKARWL